MQQKIKRLPPMQVRRSRRWPSVENVLLACMLAAALLVPYMTVLVPLREAMLSVKTEMCGGDIDFVVTGTSGQMYTSLSASAGAPPSSDVRNAELAVNEILSGEAKRNGITKYSIWEGGSIGLLLARRQQLYPDSRKSSTFAVRMTGTITSLQFCRVWVCGLACQKQRPAKSWPISAVKKPLSGCSRWKHFGFATLAPDIAGALGHCHLHC